MNGVEAKLPNDQELVARSRRKDLDAFEILVQRYQNLVCSISYAITGNLDSSEDLGQESFITAWEKLDTLDEDAKFKSWICSIARFKSLTFVRKKHPDQLETLSCNAIAPEPGPETQAMSSEQSEAIWKTLSGLPNQYREPLVLYYRNGQSVAEVASLLDLSADVVKQRLSRGRNILRDSLLSEFGDRVRQTAPKAAFTAGVVAAVGALGTKSAVAGGAVAGTIAGKTIAKTSVAGSTIAGKGLASGAGLFASVTAAIIGSMGVAANMWATWSLTRHKNRRRLMIQGAVLSLIVSLAFLIVLACLVTSSSPAIDQRTYMAKLVGLQLLFFTIMGAIAFWLCRKDMLLRHSNQEAGIAEIPRNPTATWLERWQGRCWTSKTCLLGAPLLDIQFMPLADWTNPLNCKRASGWIAIGDVATGRLIGAGYFAVAPVAIGNFALGILSLGVLSAGVIGLGIVTIGAVSSGNLSVGVFATGNVSLGFVSRGINAFGVDAASWARVGGDVEIASRLSGYADYWILAVADQYQHITATLAKAAGNGLRWLLWATISIALLCIYRYDKQRSPITSTDSSHLE